MTYKIFRTIFVLLSLTIIATGCSSGKKFQTVRYQIADDFVLVCPTEEVLDPNHPCHGRGTAQGPSDDFVLVCPTKEVLDPEHPCHGRGTAQASLDVFVLVCPVKEVLDPGHPCAE